jgi:hypothetical protein
MNMPATQSIAPRRSGTRSNGTRTDYAYETDGDLDWMREQFAGGATASMPDDTWVGIDYAYDKSGRQTLMSATDSVIMGRCQRRVSMVRPIRSIRSPVWQGGPAATRSAW